MNVYHLQNLMGHSDLQVLNRYLKQSTKDVSDARRQAGPVNNSLHFFEYRHTRYLIHSSEFIDLFCRNGIEDFLLGGHPQIRILPLLHNCAGRMA